MTPTLSELETTLRSAALSHARNCAAWATESHTLGLDRPHRADFWQESAEGWWQSAFFWLRIAGAP